MKRALPTLFFVLAAALALPPRSHAQDAAKGAPRARFLPAPLDDEWTRWIVGDWEGSGRSDAGQGKGTVRIESALNGQFLICRGEAKITSMTPQQADYLKKNMHASDEEISRFKREGYQSLEVYTIDQTTGEVVGHLFDSLRCIATGRGQRQGNRETIDWQWASGHKSTRITEKAGDDKMLIVERTPMPGGSVMEDKGEMTRKKAHFPVKPEGPPRESPGQRPGNAGPTRAVSPERQRCEAF